VARTAGHSTSVGAASLGVTQGLEPGGFSIAPSAQQTVFGWCAARKGGNTVLLAGGAHVRTHTDEWRKHYEDVHGPTGRRRSSVPSNGSASGGAYKRRTLSRRNQIRCSNTSTRALDARKPRSR
jgi:hypothetical protein